MSSPSSPLDPTHSFGIIPGTSNLSSLIKFSFFSFIVYQFLTWLYRITLHPLAKYPGPKIWGATALAQTWYALHGDFAFKVAELHAEYGPVVRIGPRAVSFINEKAWEDIHGRYDGRKQLQKAKEFVPTSPPNGAQGLVFVRDDAAHARIRRNFSHGFSDKALRQQGPLIAGYFEALLDKMTSSGRANEPLNVIKWFQLTTFDIVSDLTYGESMGCMKEDAEDLHVSPPTLTSSELPFSLFLTIIAAMDKKPLLHCQSNVSPGLHASILPSRQDSPGRHDFRQTPVEEK